MPFVASDPVNRSIWAESIQLQRMIGRRYSDLLTGGAQQAMPKVSDRHLFSPERPLPWVPDLVGSQFGKDPRSVLIVASSYNGFIEGYSKRDAVMPLHEYVNAGNDDKHGLERFCRAYFEHIVVGDEAYYQPILRDLLPGAGIDIDCCCLTDLCKASFVKRGSGPVDGNRGDVGSDAVIKEFWPQWVPYVNDLADGAGGVPLPYQWLWDRMQGCRAIIALGIVAEYGVLKIFQRMAGQPKAWSHHDNRVHSDLQTTNADVTSWAYGYTCSKRKLGSWLNSEDWWVMIDSGNKPRWFMLPVYHPAYAIGRRGDSGYEKTAPKVRRMTAAI